MESLDLVAICASAFVGVFLLLSVLAIVMRVLLVVFPERADSNAAMVAAVSTVLQTIYPGTKITNVEELK